MGILDSIKNALNLSDTKQNEFDNIVERSRNEYATSGNYFWNIKMSAISIYSDEVAKWPDKKRIEFAIYCLLRIHKFNADRKGISSADPAYQSYGIAEAYLGQLFKAKLRMDEADIERLCRSFAEYNKWTYSDISHWPIGALLHQIGQQYKQGQLSQNLISTLTLLKDELNKIKDHGEKEKLKLLNKLDTILFEPKDENDVKPSLFSGEDDFATYANEFVYKLSSGDKKIWYRLIAKAQSASGSKPSNKYLEDTRSLFKEVGADKFKKTIQDWFSFLINLKDKTEEHSYTHNGKTHSYVTIEYINPLNAEAIKGFIWMCSHFHDTLTLHTIANLAERAYRKIPGKGPAAASVGNACLYTLYKSKGLDGIGQLSRLKLRIKQSSTQGIIEKYLLAAAKEQGVSLHEIEDMAVEDFDLTSGVKEVVFDDYKAVLEITGVGRSEIRWVKPDGSGQKAPPSFVKDKYGAKLKKLKDTQKQIDQTTAAQRDRIDRMLRADRKWKMTDFAKLYLDHGLMNTLSSKIIWTFSQGEQKQSAILINGQWVTNKGEIVVQSNDAEVSLWHPAAQSVAEIKQWRDFLIENKIQQPIKQAYREVYLLTDAEINTKTYSNRMAAHVLKQHQFNMLAKTRGWRYALMGAFDNGVDNGTASLKLNEYGLNAEYWVNELNADGATNDTGIWNYVTTDQVRFISQSNNEVIDLVDVPAIPFSEVLRDVDLFVGVASVGNDPTWQDSGGVPAYRDYWTSYSFGDLSEVAKNRKEVLQRIIPRLKINKVTEIKDKFVVVQGKLRTYKIHIGSTNILMEPNDQYLCIVPDRSKKDYTENLFIPFEGDTGLSIILSKAFLLAEDDKITDSTITSQINRK